VISIITAVYNQLAVNRLFVDALRRYTHHPYELIIIDNGSTDGSAEFFEQQGATVIRNGGNYSYPRCQNQGIRAARFDYLAFLNNDIIVSPEWDRRLIDSLRHNGLDVITCCGIEQIESRGATRALRRRWKLIKNLVSLFGVSETSLRLMHALMYGGNWEGFAQRRYERFRLQVKEGFVGNTVLMTRAAIERIGPWDERIQGADFDLYLRSKERALREGDIKPVHIALDTFIHHYIRLTFKAGYPPFADAGNLIELDRKWAPEQTAYLNQLESNK
jgi:GT2 family glycosyltransferase